MACPGAACSTNCSSSVEGAGTVVNTGAASRRACRAGPAVAARFLAGRAARQHAVRQSGNPRPQTAGTARRPENPGGSSGRFPGPGRGWSGGIRMSAPGTLHGAGRRRLDGAAAARSAGVSRGSRRCRCRDVAADPGQPAPRIVGGTASGCGTRMNSRLDRMPEPGPGTEGLGRPTAAGKARPRRPSPLLRIMYIM